MATLEDATEQVNLYRDALDAGECVVQEWRPMNMHSFTGRRTSTTSGTRAIRIKLSRNVCRSWPNASARYRKVSKCSPAWRIYADRRDGGRREAV